MSEAKEPTVRVRIQARQVVRYDQIREMPVSEWNRLKAIGEDDIGDNLGGGWLDLHDVDDGEQIEGDDVEMFVCDEDGKPVTPRDRYEGGDGSSDEDEDEFDTDDDDDA